MRISRLCSLTVCMMVSFTACCQGLQDKTLRLDYIFNGTDTTCDISLHGMTSWDGWSGRTVNMKDVPVAGNGEICMLDAQSGDTLYRNTFCTLFQEWQAIPEAKTVRKSFENSFLVPMPRREARVCIRLFDHRREVSAVFEHPVDPSDILIRKAAARTVEAEPSAYYIWKGGDSRDVIDVAVIAEGYTAEEMPVFEKDAQDAVEAIFSHEPFASMRDRFNFIAVAAPSKDSGVSVPRRGEWKSTPLSSHFDTFYSERYLTTSAIFQMHDLLEGLPYEHIIILANTDVYGGGGIYNSYTLTTAHHSQFRPVVVHEFGHSFGALADEYAYAGEEDPYYFADVEPWEQNITTQADFGSKWRDMVGIDGVGLFEGAGYLPKGVWRPVEDCRMRTNAAGGFCPVCRRAIERIVIFNTEER
ncbi:MAG: IgA Peptidase M64 [Bacteroidales bacterium]|nr:IgA Peptidase M64 [Bacteroidales bacterium]